jgi:ankyrin repeat protein
MSESPAATLRYQPERLCKRGAGKLLESNEESGIDCIGKDIDHRDHGCQAVPVHNCPPTWDHQEMSQLSSEELASPTSQRSGAAITFYDYRDPAHLFRAIHWGEMRDVKEWCSDNAIDTTTLDAEGRPVLHLGAKQGEHALFDLLWRKSGIGIDTVDASGKTALFYAAENERAALVQRLICSYGASRNIRDGLGRTPLSYAAEYNSYRSVELLLQSGAEYTSEDDSGRTPLFYAVEAGNCATTVRLVRHIGNGNRALILATSMGQTKIESKLMTMGRDVADWEDDNLRDLLLHSARDGRDDMVRVLLRHHRVEVDTQDGDGRTPLSLAAELGHCNIIRILSRCGAKHGLEDEKGQSPVDYASRHGASTHRCILKSRIPRSHNSRYLLRTSKLGNQRTAEKLD